MDVRETGARGLEKETKKQRRETGKDSANSLTSLFHVTTKESVHAKPHHPLAMRSVPRVSAAPITTLHP